MKEEEIKEYRKILEKEFMDKDIEIETTLSYITIGSLGFFITINEKFLKIQTANYKIFLISSLVFLFLAFVLILIRKSRTSHHDLKMIDYINKMHPNSDEEDQNLLKMWDSSNLELKRIRNITYLSLGFGIGLQVIFLTLNI